MHTNAVGDDESDEKVDHCLPDQIVHKYVESVGDTRV